MSLLSALHGVAVTELSVMDANVPDPEIRCHWGLSVRFWHWKSCSYRAASAGPNGAKTPGLRTIVSLSGSMAADTGHLTPVRLENARYEPCIGRMGRLFFQRLSQSTHEHVFSGVRTGLFQGVIHGATRRALFGAW